MTWSARIRKDKMKGLNIDSIPKFHPGDPAPERYLQWHEWAKVQHNAGLRQYKCQCGLWHFPQEKCTTSPLKPSEQKECL